MAHPRVHARLTPVIETGQAATCAIIDLEVLYSTRKAEEHGRARARRTLAYRHVPLTEAIFQRASNLTVLHYDADFDTIAAVTGQVTEWVAPRGSL
ncbi:MAG: PIN domain nuclease [Gemmatimonadales bacterium]|nr:PIN domain nuclease [Gemmatimonadales bacterium]MYG50180.1 PIN domain nuclease [Gemmatimonadales bacterium]MYK02602.1 PIN domain nuclease [Candidatus Palauibacter ramosifaciens]